MIPSRYPSLVPSIFPSGLPSQYPSSEPSDMPSEKLSLAPSSNPSGLPSNVPSHSLYGSTMMKCNHTHSEVTCDSSEYPVDIVIVTDSYPDEIHWSLDELGGNEKFSSLFMNSSQITYCTGICLSLYRTYNFTIFDVYGDGLCCNDGKGEFKIFRDKDIIIDGGSFNNMKSSTLYPIDQPSSLPSISAFPSRSPLPSPEPSSSSFPTSIPTPTVSLKCSSSQFMLRINVKTDDFPTEINWIVEDVNGQILMQNPDYVSGQTIYAAEKCFAQTFNYNFTIYDTANDGLCCSYGSGWYSIYMDQLLVKVGGEFKESESTILHANLFPTPSMVPSSLPSRNPTTVLTLLPSETVQPSSTPVCSKQESMFSIVVFTDNFPEETIWVLHSKNAITKELTSPKYTNRGKSYKSLECILTNAEYNFTLFDLAGDGICCNDGKGWYTVSVDDNVVISGGNFGYNVTSIFNT